MLEETTRHFVVCQPKENSPDASLATQLAALISESEDDRNRLTTAFVKLQSTWLHDLNALAVCTRSEPRKES